MIRRVLPRTYFEYSVRGPLVKNAVVGEVLGTDPTHVISGGARRGVKTALAATAPFSASVWLLSTEGVVESSDITVHARWLLAKIGEGVAALRPHVREWSAEQRFSVFCDTEGHGGRWLEPDVLRAIGSLDVPLYIDLPVAHGVPAQDRDESGEG